MRRAPEDADAWRVLAALARRSGRRVSALAGPGAAARLLGLRLRGGAVADLVHAALEDCGLEPLPSPAPALARAWSAGGAGEDDGGAFDLATGAPLVARTRRGQVELCWVPPGTLRMGGGHGDWDGPPHPVDLAGFWVGRYPVTVRQYGAYLAATESEAPDHWAAQARRPDRPVVFVDWAQASAFCRWAGGDLPTEAQWERAARADGEHRNPWGDEPAAAPRANLPGGAGIRAREDWDRFLTAGDAFPAGVGPFGAADLVGNVAEWCRDWFGSAYYWHAPRRDPVGPEGGEYRVSRGGSWYRPRVNASATRRAYAAPEARVSYRGLRLVVPAPEGLGGEVLASEAPAMAR